MRVAQSRTLSYPTVIRRLEGADETSQERLVKKQLPAWVISGAVHVAMISLAILLVGISQTTTEVTGKIIVSSVESPEAQEEAKNLVIDDPGLDTADLPTTVDSARIADQNVVEKVTDNPIGTENPSNINQMTQNIAGLLEGTGGQDGTTGNLLQGGGGIGGFFHAPGLGGRSGSAKQDLITNGGGNPESERAVARGLIWLARIQKGEPASRLGWWEYDTDVGTAHKNDVVAATGMALLPFLAAGETHKTGKTYLQTVSRGVEFLKSRQAPNGSFTNPTKPDPNMYGQAIAAMALIECYAMTRDPVLKPFAQKAVNFIQGAQGPNGSWGYSPRTDGDVSIVGWQVQALHSARLCKDLVVTEAVFKKANIFLDFASTGSNKDKYGYRDSTGAAPGTARTAVGLLCRYYENGWGPNHPGMIDGVKGLMNRPPRRGSLDMYYCYYATQVVHFFEGKSWKLWNEGEAPGTGMRDILISLQNKGADQKLYGSWEPDNGTIGRTCGRVGTTALSLLTLEVYYRHLPLYKRENAGGLKVLDGGD